MPSHVEELLRRAADQPELVGLAGGLPSPRQFPRRALTRTFLRAIGADAAPALQYGWPEGEARLRARIAERLRRRGAAVDPDDVVVTHGAQQAIALTVAATCRAGDLVAVDPATYSSALDLFRGAGLRVGVERDDAALVYAMPALGNPSGRAIDAAERAALLASPAPVVEDDAYAEVRFDGDVPRPLLADAPGRVWHVGTFSKVLAPGLRVGFLVPPRDRREEVVALKQGHDLQASSLAQGIVEGVLAAPGYDARLERLRTFYRRRAIRLVQAVRRHLPTARFTPPQGGFSLWLDLGAVDEVALLERAVEEGVSFDPGSLFLARPEPGRTFVRLCYSWAPADRFEEGAARLARALAATRG